SAGTEGSHVPGTGRASGPGGAVPTRRPPWGPEPVTLSALTGARASASPPRGRSMRRMRLVPLQRGKRPGCLTGVTRLTGVRRLTGGVMGLPGVMGLIRRTGARARLGRVDDDALADERVQRAVGRPHDRWLLHDLPDQQPVVGPGQRVIVVMHAHSALQPP